MHYLKGILEPGAEKDYFTRHKQRYATILSLIRALDVGEKLRVLDVGSGFGHLTILVKKIFDYEVYAVDCNSLREERLRKEGIKFNLCDLMTESLPFGGNYFDIVVFSEVIEHLFTLPLITLLDIHPVLKRQGLLILTTPNLYSLGNRILFLTGRRIIAPVTIGGNEGRVLKSIGDRSEFHSLIEACLCRQEKYGEGTRRPDALRGRPHKLVYELIHRQTPVLGGFPDSHCGLLPDREGIPALLRHRSSSVAGPYKFDRSITLQAGARPSFVQEGVKCAN